MIILASYRQYRHSSSSDFGRPVDLHLFDWFNEPFTRWQMSSVPFVGDFYKAMDQQKYWNDYLKAHKMTWDDVKYPALLGGMTAVGAGVSVGSGVSRNVMRLYR